MCDDCGSAVGYPRYDLPGVPDLCPDCYSRYCPDIEEEEEGSDMES